MILWLRAGTLAWFRIAEFRKDAGIWRAYRHSFATSPRWLSGLLVFVVVAWMLLGSARLRSAVRSVARQKLNAGPSPRNIMNDVNWLLACDRRLRAAGSLDADRYHGCSLWRPSRASRAFAPSVEHGRLLVVVLLLLGAGLYVPYRLVWWIPELQTIRQQAWSMGMRFLLAYLIVVTAFIAIIWIAGMYTDREDPL